MERINDAVIVSCSFGGEGNDLLLVGKQEKGKVQVVNAFQGEQAREIWNKLTRKNVEADAK